MTYRQLTKPRMDQWWAKTPCSATVPFQDLIDKFSSRLDRDFGFFKILVPVVFDIWADLRGINEAPIYHGTNLLPDLPGLLGQHLLSDTNNSFSVFLLEEIMEITDQHQLSLFIRVAGERFNEYLPTAGIDHPVDAIVKFGRWVGKDIVVMAL